MVKIKLLHSGLKVVLHLVAACPLHEIVLVFEIQCEMVLGQSHL